MLLNGSEILLECLLEQDVDTVFGYPGGAVLNIYDALYKYKDKIRHIRTSHEQGAAHAADGYARAGGKVGVCIATSGPGATNLVTGIATAYMDSIPMVAITGNVSLPLLGRDSFQEVDIAGITMPITKHNFIVKDISELAKTIRRAFYLAKEGRPGPVLVDIPKNITAESFDYVKETPKQILKKTEFIRENDITKALAVINESKKPLIYSGGGVISSDASRELETFADLVDAPVCVSLMGLGGFNSINDRFIGMVGMHGTKTSNLSVSNCDLLIAIGARFSDRVVSNAKLFATNAKILHIDVDPSEIGKNIKTVNSIIGDIQSVLCLLNDKLIKKNNTQWIDLVYKWKAQYPVKYADTGAVRAQNVIEKLYEITNGNAIIATEVGQNQIWAAQCYQYTKPRQFVSSGGLGTMGYGLGASIGAQVACPDSVVVNIAGDGSFRMNLNELITAASYDIPVIVLVLNNETLGMVRQWQKLFYESRYSQTDIKYPISYAKLAEAFGIDSYEIINVEDCTQAFKSAIQKKRPAIIHVPIHMDEMVFPMVPPGAAINETIMEGEI